MEDNKAQKNVLEKSRRHHAALEHNLRQCSFRMLDLKHSANRMVIDSASALDIINGIEQVAIRIAKSNEKPFELRQRKDCSLYLLTPLGKNLWRLASLMDKQFHMCCDRHEFNPYITVMRQAFRRCESVLGFEAQGTGITSGLFRRERAVLTLLVKLVRREFRTKQFKRIVRNYDRCGHKDFQSGCRHMANCFERYARLLIVRVDLHCSPEDLSRDYTANIDKAYDRFMRALSDGRIRQSDGCNFPKVITWMGRRENGFERGMHYHILVALDGHDHQSGFHYSEELGLYWKKCCAAQGLDGTFFNSFLRQKDFIFNALGMIKIDDWDALIGLREVIRYLTKGYFKVKSGGTVKRNFRRAQTKKQQNRRGAPRKLENDMSHVLQILGSV